MSYYVDTNIFLNVIYKEPDLGEKSSGFLRHIHDGRYEALTSSVTILEVILDMADSGFMDLTGVAIASIEDIRNMEIVPLDKAMTKLAADHVVRDGLTIHDAYHVATALFRRADAFVTRDENLKRKIRKYIKTIAPEEA